jgi:large subunit ribosomal protein L24e
MVKCSFCNKTLEKGTGKLYVYATGKTENFCSSKCEKNLRKLTRKPSKFKWASKIKTKKDK